MNLKQIGIGLVSLILVIGGIKRATALFTKLDNIRNMAPKAK